MNNDVQLLAQQIARLSTRSLADDVDVDRIGAYHSYGELLTRMRRLVERGAHVQCVGRTVCDQPLFALAIGPDMAPLTSVIVAGLHPIEWIGVETGFALLERLVGNPPTDRVVLAFPVINVDGYRMVESDLRIGRRRWHRSNARGVDLNRNWPTHHSARRPLGRVLAGYNNGGAAPLSEPEIAAVVGTLDRIDQRSRIDVALSLHSIGRMVLIPYGGVWRASKDAPRLMRAARSVQSRFRQPYRIRQSSRWVPGAFAHGMELDHLHARYGATALLVECSTGGMRVGEPSTWLHPFRWFNPRDPGSTTGSLAVALEPFIRGQF